MSDIDVKAMAMGLLAWRAAILEDDFPAHGRTTLRNLVGDLADAAIDLESMSADRDRLRKDNVRLQEALGKIDHEYDEWCNADQEADTPRLLRVIAEVTHSAREVLAATDDLSGWVLVNWVEVERRANELVQSRSPYEQCAALELRAMLDAAQKEKG